MGTLQLSDFNRLPKDVIDNNLYPIFVAELDKSPFLNTVTRGSIIKKWAKILPRISTSNLRICLSRMERSYFENMAVINREGLRNRIIEQQQYLNELVMASNLPLDKKSRAIAESNNLQAKVGQLADLAPSVEIKINTSINEHELAVKMNKINEAEQASLSQE